MTVTRRPRVAALLVDLDDCLYQSPECQHQVAQNIRRYMAEVLGVPADEVAEQCADLYLNYGTTLAGLVARGHSIDYASWHAAVHGSLDYEAYLRPDPELRALLDSIPLPKYVFTNADTAHAQRCLALLGIAGCFERVIAFEDVMAAAEAEGLVRHGRPVVCKPNRQAFDIAMRLAGGLQPSTTLWLDDSARNITTGHRMGFFSVLVGRTGVACPSDHQIRSIHDLTSLPWLWAGQQPPLAAAPAPASAADAALAADAPPSKAMVSGSGIKAAAGSSSEGETIEAVHVAT